jgi:hypothetical protein
VLSTLTVGRQLARIRVQEGPARAVDFDMEVLTSIGVSGPECEGRPVSHS